MSASRRASQHDVSVQPRSRRRQVVTAQTRVRTGPDRPHPDGTGSPHATLYLRRSGPGATAGVAGSALTVPVLMSFITASADAGSSVAINIVVLVSLAAWLASYLVVPGAQGHVFYLGLFETTSWFYVQDKIEPNVLAAVVLAPFGQLDPSGGNDGFGFVSYPHVSTIATISILITPAAGAAPRTS